LSNGAPAVFLFATENGTIVGWNGALMMQEFGWIGLTAYRLMGRTDALFPGLS
jgi:hypothetical protein